MDKIKLSSNDIILFQGDSITDCGRKKDDFHSLGNGYPHFVDLEIKKQFSSLSLKCLNRGISGNRVKDLVNRWKSECIDLTPKVVSILIGINDTWRKFDRNDATNVDDFYRDYKSILLQTKQQLNDPLIILLEPFLLPIPEDRKAWREDLDPKIHAIRDLAREFKAIYLPLDGIFAQESSRKGCAYLAPDGVHPSVAGHELIARNWLQTFLSILE